MCPSCRETIQVLGKMTCAVSQAWYCDACGDMQFAKADDDPNKVPFALPADPETNFWDAVQTVCGVFFKVVVVLALLAAYATYRGVFNGVFGGVLK